MRLDAETGEAIAHNAPSPATQTASGEPAPEVVAPTPTPA
jgi:hypothetical protein